jgi:hypothetical protein
MGSVLDATANRIRICARPMRLWNGDIKESMRTVRRERGRRCNLKAAAGAKAELKKSIQQSNRKVWCDYLQNLRGAEVWRAE